jgi:hypothetical protein
MSILIIGIILLLIVYFAVRHIKEVEKREAELEEMDNYSKKIDLLDRGIDLLGRKEVLDTKINVIKEKTKQYDN